MRQMMATKAGKALDSGESVVTTTLSLANWLTLVSIGLSVHFYYLNMWLVTELQFEVRLQHIRTYFFFSLQTASFLDKSEA